MVNKKTTIKQVADVAKVSPTTVSLILNGRGARFGEKTKTRVLEAAKQLNYRPDYYARGLAGQRDNRIGVIVPDIQNPFFTELFTSIQDRTIERGYYPEVFSVKGFEKNLDTFVSQFINGTQQGLILAISGVATEIIPRIKSIYPNLPLVLTDQADANNESRIMIDEYQAGYQAASFIVEQGHKKITLVMPHESSMNMRLRLKGYHDALRDGGIKRESLQELRTELSIEGGLAVTKEITLGPSTAIICASDYMAIGLYTGLQRLGKRIPTDYSIIGFDNILLSKYQVPALTTVAQPIGKLAELSVESVLSQIQGEAVNDVLLPVELVIRDSVRTI